MVCTAVSIDENDLDIMTSEILDVQKFKGLVYLEGERTTHLVAAALPVGFKTIMGCIQQYLDIDFLLTGKHSAPAAGGASLSLVVCTEASSSSSSIIVDPPGWTFVCKARGRNKGSGGLPGGG